MSDTDALLRQVLERLDHLETRLDEIQGVTDGLGSVGSKAPVFIEFAATSAEYAWDQAEAAGIDPIKSGTKAMGLALEAGKLDNIALIERAMGKMALLSKTLDAVDTLEADGTIDTLVDSGVGMAPLLAKMISKPGVRGLLETAAAEEAIVDTVGSATTALVETRQQGWSPLGFFGQLKMLGDSDVQKAIGFTLAVAKRFGKQLS